MSDLTGVSIIAAVFVALSLGLLGGLWESIKEVTALRIKVAKQNAYNSDLEIQVTFAKLQIETLKHQLAAAENLNFRTLASHRPTPPQASPLLDAKSSKLLTLATNNPNENEAKNAALALCRRLVTKKR